jgi:hypothetical protein
VLLTSFVSAEPLYDCDAGRHKEVVIRRVEPTATTDGYETLKCELCERKYDVVLSATDHIWGAWIIDKAPTCTEPGKRHRTCTRGTPHNEYEVIPALGHDYALTVTPPTCEEPGLKTYVCKRDGTAYTEQGEAALGHEYKEEVTKEPTCAEEGVKTFTCIRDPGEVYTEPIPKVDHRWGEWRVEKPAKEGVAGVEVRVCAVGGERETRTAAALPTTEKPLFNAVDAASAGVNFGLIGFFILFLLPCIRTVSKEQKAYKEYKRRKELAEKEARKHDDH